MVLWLRKRSVYFAAKMPAEQAEAWQKRSKHRNPKANPSFNP